jgi:LPS sulfotransferase NodH
MMGSINRQGKRDRGRRSKDENFLSEIASVNYRPVFVLGSHRSGTTILYKLLALTESFNIVTLYHTLRFDELLAHHLQSSSDYAREQLNRELDSLCIHNRIIDEMEIDADYPDEYCFVLAARTRSFHITNKTWNLFDELCRKIQFISDPDRQLLLKNPFDYANFVQIRRFVPDTKFIFIHRHPVHVINSALKAVRTSWYEGNPLNQLRSETYTKLQRSWLFSTFIRWMTSPRSRVQLGRRFITQRLCRNETYFIRKIETLSPNEYISIRYEDLIIDPNEVIARILEFLQVEVRVKVNYRQYVQPRPIRLLPEVKREEEKLYQTFHEILTYHRYLDAQA